MAVIETWFRQNLDKAVQVQTINGAVFTEDNEGNLVGVRCYRGGDVATLTGTVSGYVIRQDEQTVTIDTGVLNGNAASILLPSEALEVPGIAHIIIRLTNGDVKTTLCAIRVTVQRSRSENIIHGDRVIYSVDDMLRQIADCEAATEAAELATTAAGSATTAANSAASSATTAAELADTKAGLANTAATNANTAKENANTQANRAKAYADCFDNTVTVTGNAGTSASVVFDTTNPKVTFTIPRGVDGTGAVSTVENLSPDANHNVSLGDLFLRFTAQTVATAQQEQARSNIGAAGLDDLALLTPVKVSGESNCGISNRNSNFTFDYIERYAVGSLLIYAFAITVSTDIAVWSTLFDTTGLTGRVTGFLSKAQSYETSEMYRESGVKISTAVTAGSWRGIMITFG